MFVSIHQLAASCQEHSGEGMPGGHMFVGAPYQVLGGLLLGIFSWPFWHPPVFEGPLAINEWPQSEALEGGFV